MVAEEAKEKKESVKNKIKDKEQSSLALSEIDLEIRKRFFG